QRDTELHNAARVVRNSVSAKRLSDAACIDRVGARIGLGNQLVCKAQAELRERAAARAAGFFTAAGSAAASVASLARRSARSRAVLASTLACSAWYSRIACVASRSRLAFLAAAASCVVLF